MIPTYEQELTTDNITKQYKNWIECVEAKIENSKKNLFDGTDPEKLYYNAFGDIDYADGKFLPYGDDIKEQKEAEVKNS